MTTITFKPVNPRITYRQFGFGGWLGGGLRFETPPKRPRFHIMPCPPYCGPERTKPTTPVIVKPGKEGKAQNLPEVEAPTEKKREELEEKARELMEKIRKLEDEKMKLLRKLNEINMELARLRRELAMLHHEYRRPIFHILPITPPEFIELRVA